MQASNIDAQPSSQSTSSAPASTRQAISEWRGFFDSWAPKPPVCWKVRTWNRHVGDGILAMLDTNWPTFQCVLQGPDNRGLSDFEGIKHYKGFGSGDTMIVIVEGSVRGFVEVGYNDQAVVINCTSLNGKQVLPLPDTEHPQIVSRNKKSLPRAANNLQIINLSLLNGVKCRAVIEQDKALFNFNIVRGTVVTVYDGAANTILCQSLIANHRVANCGTLVQDGCYREYFTFLKKQLEHIDWRLYDQGLAPNPTKWSSDEQTVKIKAIDNRLIVSLQNDAALEEIGYARTDFDNIITNALAKKGIMLR